MSKVKNVLKPTRPRGFVDRSGEELTREEAMVSAILEIYKSHGFIPLETPIIEYADALGKFLPDADRPNEGVFAFQDDDEEWLSLRYDLTAPLARHVAELYQHLPKPYRTYRAGPVFRNEKPGPGRFRQFIQCDADTVGTASPLADAEMCLMAVEALTNVGLSRAEFEIKLSHRGLLDGLMQSLHEDVPAGSEKHATIFRAIDKLDRLGVEGVRELLGAGREDASGDYTEGAKLSDGDIQKILTFLSAANQVKAEGVDTLKAYIGESERGQQALEDLKAMQAIFDTEPEQARQIIVDPSIVRGLAYYTGPIFEANVTFETVNDKGESVIFGAVGGGGRYDGLISRFRTESVPATGFSIGVSRLASALRERGKAQVALTPPVIVAIMDQEFSADSFRIAAELRRAGITAECYAGTSGLKAQMKYADRRNAPAIIIQGSDERARGEVQIKDLIEGKRQAETIETNAEWREARPAQVSVKRADMIETLRKMLA